MVRKVFITIVSFLISIYSICYGNSDGNIILCADGLGSVETSDLCDYKADCNDASDELNFKLCKMLSRQSCSRRNGEVECDDYNRYGSRDHFYGARCINIIDACNAGPRCFSKLSDEEEWCKEVPNGRLKVPKFTELSKLEEAKEEEREFPKLMKFIGEAMNETVKKNFSECPPFFTPFGNDKCISLFTPIQVSWFEARIFCESMTGGLVILDSIDIYIQLLKYIQEKEITSRFWIGAKNGLSESGNSTNSNRVWTWLNGKPVTMGAPFWSLFTVGTPERAKQCQDNERKLMPRYTEEAETCLSILQDNFYYFSDERCTTKLSPLCMTNKI